ncbi:hypothetical protein [Pedobacter cryoconitis]|uniref:Uncharacterized protein n=1 Tax=Pedobacter cryoconitis TaxID=188932 RepID=A0A327SJA3_9SPHI|nr:hypothetical protein [Pedobacter cryoconitis]RAJ28911.1 hypothetical protein LY11_03185 [Pedobacter cryoconitis]
MTEDKDKYTEAEILNYMERNPELNVFQIAQELRIPTHAVGQAQHNRMKSVLSKNRYSAAWQIPRNMTDDRLWLTKSQFEKAVVRIKSGELGVIAELSKNHRISTAHKRQLEKI